MSGTNHASLLHCTAPLVRVNWAVTVGQASSMIIAPSPSLFPPTPSYLSTANREATDSNTQFYTTEERQTRRFGPSPLKITGEFEAMDPATIIGTTSAILSFVQFTGKIISTAIENRDNAGQVTKSNQELDATVSEFNSRLAKLKSQRPALSKSSSGVLAVEDDAQASLLLSLSKCEDLGHKIQKLLKEMSIKKMDATKSSAKKSRSQEYPPGTPENCPSALPAKASLPQAFKATVKSLWLEKDVKSLREQWESCVKEFNVNFMRYVEYPFTHALKVQSNNPGGVGACTWFECEINEICT